MEIIERGELKFVGIKVIGRRSELSHRVPLAWLELTRRLEEIPNRVESPLFYGVFPESDQNTDGQNGIHRYCVMVEVATVAEPLPEGMTAQTIPAQRYAVGRVQGGAEQIEPCYIALFREIAAAGLAHRNDSYGFEVYDTRRQTPTPPYDRFDYDVFKPVQ